MTERTSPDGAAPRGTSPDDVVSRGTSPDDVASQGAASDGAASEVTPPAGTAPTDTPPTDTSTPVQQPSFGRWMGSMWLYTTLRFALFFALWGILVLVGLQPLFGAFLALVLSVPLSYVLLAKPRRAFTATLEARVDARRAERSALDRELDPDDPGTGAPGLH